MLTLDDPDPDEIYQCSNCLAIMALRYTYEGAPYFILRSNRDLKKLAGQV